MNFLNPRGSAGAAGAAAGDGQQQAVAHGHGDAPRGGPGPLRLPRGRPGRVAWSKQDKTMQKDLMSLGASIEMVEWSK